MFYNGTRRFYDSRSAALDWYRESAGELAASKGVAQYVWLGDTVVLSSTPPGDNNGVAFERYAPNGSVMVCTNEPMPRELTDDELPF